MKNFTHPFSKTRAISRLKKELQEHEKLLIAFDFDNTIYDYHQEGGDYGCVIELLKKCSDLGHTLILFTSEDSSEKLQFKREYCESLGLRVDYVNSDPVFGTHKPYYNILLDDRAGLQEAYEVLDEVINTSV